MGYEKISEEAIANSGYIWLSPYGFAYAFVDPVYSVVCSLGIRSARSEKTIYCHRGDSSTFVSDVEHFEEMSGRLVKGGV